MIAAFDEVLARAEKAEASLAVVGVTLAHAQERAEKAEAALAEAEAQRDAAVARNIILHQQKTKEAEDARVERVPVADFAHRVREVIDEAAMRPPLSLNDEGFAAWVERLQDKLRDLRGWDGTCGRPARAGSTCGRRMCR
jgi:hypothetical protein